MATPIEETQTEVVSTITDVGGVSLKAGRVGGDGVGEGVIVKVLHEAMTSGVQIGLKEYQAAEDIRPYDAAADDTVVEAGGSKAITKDASVLVPTQEGDTPHGPGATSGDDKSLGVTIPEDALASVESIKDGQRIGSACAPTTTATKSSTPEQAEPTIELKPDGSTTPSHTPQASGSAQAPTPDPPLDPNDLSTVTPHLPPDPHFHMPRGPFWTPRLDALLHARTPQLTLSHIFRYTPQISFTFRRLLHIPPLNPRLSIYRQALRHTPARRRVLLIKVMQGTGKELTATLSRASEELFYLARRRRMTLSAFDKALPQLVAEGDRAMEMVAELREWFLEEVELWGVPVDEGGDIGTQGNIVLTGWDRIRVCVIWRTVEVAMENYQRDLGRAMGRRWGATAGGRGGWGWEWDTAVMVAVLSVGVGWALWRIFQGGDTVLEE